MQASTLNTIVSKTEITFPNSVKWYEFITGLIIHKFTDALYTRITSIKEKILLVKKTKKEELKVKLTCGGKESTECQ